MGISLDRDRRADADAAKLASRQVSGGAAPAADDGPADPRRPPDLASGPADMQPVAFAGALGWLHTPTGQSLDVGVVVVSPLGRDGRCAYMPMRLFADQLAAAGYPTIRYDHLGTGDSLDLEDADADALPQWLDGVERAANVLRARAGVSRVVLAGVRTGATLAAMQPAADGFILLAPILNGRSWIRRLQFSARVLNNRDQPSGDKQPVDTEGLWLSPATADSLSRIDLTKLPPSRAPAFVACQNEVVAGYAAGLAKGGALVRTTDFPGLNELFQETTINLPPFEVFEQARAWLQDTFQPAAAASVPAAALRNDEPLFRLPGARENVVTFGERLRGVLCEPEHATAPGAAVLFCNTGGDPRAGAGGFASRAARSLAPLGVASLRFDFPGIGDSPMPGDDIRCHVFETPREAHVDAAVNLLAERGFTDITIVGVCSGAYHAINAACRNTKINRVFAVSPIKIVWRLGDSVTFARDEYLFAFKDYARAVLDPRAWRQAVRDRINLTEFVLALANRLKNRVFGWASRRIGESPLTRMKRFAERGGQAWLLMGVNDTSLEEMETYYGPKGAEVQRLGGVTVEVVTDLDHGLTRRASRELAIDRIACWLKPKAG